MLELMRNVIGGGEAISHAPPKVEGVRQPNPPRLPAGRMLNFRPNSEKTFIAGLPATLTVLRTALQSLVKADTEVARLEHIHELYSRINAVSKQRRPRRPRRDRAHGRRARTLLKELCENRKTSTPQRCAPSPPAVDFFDFLFDHGTRPENWNSPPPAFWSWTTRPLPAAPSPTRSKK